MWAISIEIVQGEGLASSLMTSMIQKLQTLDLNLLIYFGFMSTSTLIDFLIGMLILVEKIYLHL